MTRVSHSSSQPRRLVRVHGPWVLAVTAAVMAGAWLLASHQAPVYVSTSEVVVETKVFPNTTPLAPNMATERQLVTSGVILTRAATVARMNQREMQKASSVTVPADTSFLDISCEADDPQLAQRCASSLAQTYVSYRNAQSTTPATKSTAPASGTGKVQQTPQDPVGAEVVSPANLPIHPSGTPRTLLMGIGLTLGLALGVGSAFVRDRFDDRIRGRADAEQHLGAPIPTAVPRTKRVNPSRMVTEAPQSPAAEVFRYLRVRLEAALIQPVTPAAPARGKVILVVGGNNGDGSTTVASNLSLTFALAGRRTVLVDADISHVGIEALYGLGERPGLVDLLAGSAVDPKAVLQASGLKDLRLLTAGSRAQRRRELLRADRLGAVLERLRDDADVVVVDGTSLAAASDPLMLATVSDLVLVVLHARRTTRGEVDDVAAELRSIGVTNVLGVLNHARRGDVPPARGRSTLIPQSAEASPESWQPTTAVPTALPTEHPGVLVARHAGGERAATDQMPVHPMARAGAVLTSGVSPTVDDAEQAAGASRAVKAADPFGLGATTAGHAGADAVQQTNGAAQEQDQALTTRSGAESLDDADPTAVTDVQGPDERPHVPSLDQDREAKHMNGVDRYARGLGGIRGRSGGSGRV